MKKHEAPDNARPMSPYAIILGGLIAGACCAVGAAAGGGVGAGVGLVVGIIAMMLVMFAWYSVSSRR